MRDYHLHGASELDLVVFSNKPASQRDVKHGICINIPIWCAVTVVNDKIQPMTPIQHLVYLNMGLVKLLYILGVLDVLISTSQTLHSRKYRSWDDCGSLNVSLPRPKLEQMAAISLFMILLNPEGEI